MRVDGCKRTNEMPRKTAGPVKTGTERNPFALPPYANVFFFCLAGGFLCLAYVPFETEPYLFFNNTDVPLVVGRSRYFQGCRSKRLVPRLLYNRNDTSMLKHTRVWSVKTKSTAMRKGHRGRKYPLTLRRVQTPRSAQLPRPRPPSRRRLGRITIE